MFKVAVVTVVVLLDLDGVLADRRPALSDSVGVLPVKAVAASVPDEA
jgi:hypothetical protein